ncbi:hypothetical protein [uncultured Dokdonia sp.]|uniref:hypothetical protein n=1 Tax=uncultured Dokdonia sp. TaxID=575653 RepID=UPI002618D778|nr:hypothetical protein [uncultured Dokdonia sp.]
MNKSVKLNSLFNEFYLSKSKETALQNSKEIIKFIEEIHFKEMDELSANMSRKMYQNNFNDYLDNFESEKNPFLSTVDTIRQILSFHYRFD